MSKFNRNGSIQNPWVTHGKQNWDVMAYTKLQQAACIGPSAVDHWERFSNFNAEEIFWFWMLMLLVVFPRRWCCCAWIAFPTRWSTRTWLCRCADFGDLNCLFCLTCLVCRSDFFPIFFGANMWWFFCGTFAALLLNMFRRVATFKSTHWHDMFWKNLGKLEIGGIFAMPNVDGIMNWLDLSQPE